MHRCLPHLVRVEGQPSEDVFYSVSVLSDSSQNRPGVRETHREEQREPGCVSRSLSDVQPGRKRIALLQWPLHGGKHPTLSLLTHTELHKLFTI